MEKSRQTGSFIGGSLLVAGTTIGGGMLALPVLTAAGGFMPSILVYVLCWLCMVATGLLLVEIFLWNQKETNIISMAQMTLGNRGKVAAWILYVFFFYSLTVAYIACGGNLVRDVMEALFTPSAQDLASCTSPGFVGPLLFVLLFAPFVAISAKATTRINSVLMIGLVVSFFVFLILGAKYVQAHFLTRSNLGLALLATPVAFTAFGFQGIVPTLTNYLGRDPHRTRKVILLGTAFPLLCYIAWEWLILGVVPLEGLEEAKSLGQTSVYPLKNILHIPWLFCVGEFFAFFAIVTSFFGVTLGMIDFLSDGLKVKKDIKGRTLLALLVFLPPLILALINPKIFLMALTYAGGLGSALLLGLLPILMAWSGRYVLKMDSLRLVPGGRVILSLLILFILFELVLMAIPFT